MKVKVKFSLETTDENSLTFETTGILKIDEDEKVLTFIEQTDMHLPTTIYINEKQNTVTIKRTGQIESKMIFDQVKETLSLFKVDNQYEISMYTHTNFLLIKESEIQIIYQTEIDKEQNVSHQLKVKWEENK